MEITLVNKNNFDEIINSEKKVLVDFYADWCGPCRMLAPVLDEISKECSDVKFVSVNIDDEDLLAEKYGVSSIPCLVLFDKGIELRRNIGFIPKDDIKSFLGGK